MRSVDLNCDMGEGFANDSELMDYVSSVNVACGYHAGDAATMAVTVENAIEKNVAVGAHPSFPDRENFGRIPMEIDQSDLYRAVRSQVLAFQAICRDAGAKMRHVKPHGALYNRAAVDRETAATIAEAVRFVDPALILYGLSGSHLIVEAKRLRLRTASEVFADRTYRADGTLTPRTEAYALITDAGRAAEQALSMVLNGRVRVSNGGEIPVVAETICIHGDAPAALEFAAAIYADLTRNNIKVQPLYD